MSASVRSQSDVRPTIVRPSGASRAALDAWLDRAANLIAELDMVGAPQTSLA